MRMSWRTYEKAGFLKAAKLNMPPSTFLGGSRGRNTHQAKETQYRMMKAQTRKVHAYLKAQIEQN